MRQLTPADDDLHPPASDDIFWTETAWFACAVPALGLAAHFYPVFRTNQNICSMGVYIWDARCTYHHDAIYSHTYWHLPMPPNLTAMRLTGGLCYDVLEPLKKYRVRFESDDLVADLTYTGLIAPVLTPKEDHVDQPCRVQGSFTLRGEKVDIDGFEMRDKSWHVRSDRALSLPPDIARGSYTYAIRDDVAFLAKTGGSSPDLTHVVGGWLFRDGVVAPLTGGHRHIKRSANGVGDEISIEGTDESGRGFSATGKVVSHFGYQSTPAILAYLRGTDWRIDGAAAWGEDQEWWADRVPRKIRP